MNRRSSFTKIDVFSMNSNSLQLKRTPIFVYTPSEIN